MPCFVGLDSSKHQTSICVVDPQGDVILEGSVESHPRAIVEFLRGKHLRYASIGIEAWGLASWLCEGLQRARLPAVCIEARHAHSVLRAQPNKTDKNDARGIANLMRTRTYRVVHLKSQTSQRSLALLTVRDQLKRRARDFGNAVGGILLSFGLKLDARQPATLDRRARSLAKKAFALEIVKPLLDMRAEALAHVKDIEDRIRDIALGDPVCRLLMTAPGVGPLTALLFRCTIDDPHRFLRARSLGAHLGLTPRTYQSGETEWRGRISRRGSKDLRSALYFSALSVLSSNTRGNWLKNWGLQIAARRGHRRARIAVARRLAITLHRMWVAGTTFEWETAADALQGDNCQATCDGEEVLLGQGGERARRRT